MLNPSLLLILLVSLAAVDGSLGSNAIENAARRSLSEKAQLQQRGLGSSAPQPLGSSAAFHLRSDSQDEGKSIAKDEADKVKKGIEIATEDERASTILRCESPALGMEPKDMKAPNVSVGIYILNLGADNGLSTGEFFANFLLYLRRSDRGLSWFKGEDPIRQLSFSNAKSLGTIQTHGLGVHKISGTFFFSPDLRMYPFDAQVLEVVLEQIETPMKEWTFVPEPSLNGLSTSVRFPGWVSSLRLDEGADRARCTVRAKSHIYPGATVSNVDSINNVTFSRFSYQLTVERPVLQGILTHIFPPIVVLMPILYSYILDPIQDITVRLSLSSGALVAVILIYRGVAAALPPLDYLTLFDKFIFCIYVSISVALFQAVSTYMEFHLEVRSGFPAALRIRSGCLALELTDFRICLGYHLAQVTPCLAHQVSGDKGMQSQLRAELLQLSYITAQASTLVIFFVVLPLWVWIDAYLVVPILLISFGAWLFWIRRRWALLRTALRLSQDENGLSKRLVSQESQEMMEIVHSQL